MHTFNGKMNSGEPIKVVLVDFGLIGQHYCTSIVLEGAFETLDPFERRWAISQTPRDLADMVGNAYELRTQEDQAYIEALGVDPSTVP